MKGTTTSVVDRLVSQRAWISIVLGLFVGAKSSNAFIFDFATGGPWVRVSDDLSLIAWIVWFAIVLLFALFGSGLLRSAAVRQRLNDESTMAHWQEAIRTGFWAMMAGGVLCVIASYETALTARGAVQVMVSLGVGITLLRFGQLERLALKG
jgi:hypothetical protein